MPRVEKIKIGEFLKEREGKFKPQDNLVANLKRLNKIDFSGEIHVVDKPSKTNMIVVKTGDLVISGINVSKGAIAVYHGKEPITATIHYSSYIFDEDKINIEYFKRYLKSPVFIQSLKNQVKGGIKTEIKPKHFLPLEIDLPDIDSQKKVVAFFNKIENEMKELTEEVLKQENYLKKLRQQVLYEAIEGKLTAKWRKENFDLISGNNSSSKLLEKVESKKELLLKNGKIRKGKKQLPTEIENWHINIPDEWEYPDLDDISQYVTDGTHQTPTYVNKGRMFLSAQNIKPFKFMPQEHKFVTEKAYQAYIKNRNVEKGDLLLGRVGAGIGETAVVDQNLDFAIYVSLGLIKTFKKLTCPDYLAIVFNSSYGVKYAKGNISSGGGSAGNFNLGRIRSFPVPFPSLAEQKEIVKKVNEFMAEIDLLENQTTIRRDCSDLLEESMLRETFLNQSKIGKLKECAVGVSK